MAPTQESSPTAMMALNSPPPFGPKSVTAAAPPTRTGARGRRGGGDAFRSTRGWTVQRHHGGRAALLCRRHGDCRPPCLLRHGEGPLLFPGRGTPASSLADSGASDYVPVGG